MKCEPLRVDKLQQPSVVLGTKAFQQSQKECVLLQSCQHVQTVVLGLGVVTAVVARTMTQPLKAAVPNWVKSAILPKNRRAGGPWRVRPCITAR